MRLALQALRAVCGSDDPAMLDHEVFVEQRFQETRRTCLPADAAIRLRGCLTAPRDYLGHQSTDPLRLQHYI